MKKTLSLILTLAMTISLLAGCSSDDSGDASADSSSDSSASTSTATGNDAITATADGEPEGIQAGTSITVHCGSDYVSQQLPTFAGGGDVYGAIYDTLFYSPSGQMDDITGLLAESWEISDDFLTITIQIVEGVNFANGNPLTAHSVVSSFQFYDYEVGTSLVTNMTSYEATGDYEFTIHLSSPNINFDTELCIFQTGIFDTSLYDELGNVVEAAYMVGSGPYYISDYAIGDYFVLTAKEDYWNADRQAHIETVTCKVITNTTTAYSAMAAGELDAMLVQDYETMEQLEVVDGVNIIVDAAPSAYQPIWINSSDSALCPYLGNVRVREALTMLIDTEQLVLAANGPYGYVGVNALSPNIDYEQNRVYDIDAALAILEEEGIAPSDIVLTALVTAIHEARFVNIQAQLMEVGITLNFVVQDSPAVMTAAIAGEWDLWCEHGGMSPYSMSTPLSVLMGDDAIFAVVKDPDLMDEAASLVSSAFGATTMEDQAADLVSLCQLLDENYIYICGSSSSRWYAFSDRLGNTTYQYAYFLWQVWDFYMLDV